MSNRGWQFRVLDVHIFINGQTRDIQEAKDVLCDKSAFEELIVSVQLLLLVILKMHLLQFGPFDRHGLAMNK